MKIEIQEGKGYAIFSDRELSEAVSISRPSITRWRTGARSPSWDKVHQIQDYTGLPFAFFIGRKKTANDINNLRRECLRQAKNLKNLFDAIRSVEEDYKSDNQSTKKERSDTD